MSQPAGQMILVAGPYRSGTGDDPEKMAANVRLIVYRRLSEIPGCTSHSD